MLLVKLLEVAEATAFCAVEADMDCSLSISPRTWSRPPYTMGPPVCVRLCTIGDYSGNAATPWHLLRCYVVFLPTLCLEQPAAFYERLRPGGRAVLLPRY